MRSDNSDDIVAEINVTPLVDIVLVLLIIFIVTARFTVPSTVKVDLPKTESSDAPGGGASMTMISLKPGGELFLGDVPTTLEKLPAQFADLHNANAAGQLVINADESVLHGAVIRVLDLAKRAGIEKVAVSVEEKPQ